MMQRHHHALVASSPHRPYATMQTGSRNRAPARVADIESSDRRCHNPRNAANTERVCVRLYNVRVCVSSSEWTHTYKCSGHAYAHTSTHINGTNNKQKSRNKERERGEEIRKKRRKDVNTLAFECRRCECKDNELTIVHT